MPRYVRVLTTGGPAHGVLEGDEVALVDRSPFMSHRPTGERLPLDDVTLLAPVVPTKAVCVGANYAEHTRELGDYGLTASAEEALLFLKPSSAVIGDGEPILLPTDRSGDVQHEAELAVVIGSKLTRATPDECMEGVFGYTGANDLTARDVQTTERQWFRAKGFDSFLPLGPAITTRNNVDPADLEIRCLLNGEVRQEGRTSQMTRGIADLLSEISHITTLLPSDVVLTGSPAGVSTLQPGDVVQVEIGGIGTLSNPVVDRNEPHPARG